MVRCDFTVAGNREEGGGSTMGVVVCRGRLRWTAEEDDEGPVLQGMRTYVQWFKSQRRWPFTVAWSVRYRLADGGGSNSLIEEERCDGCGTVQFRRGAWDEQEFSFGEIDNGNCGGTWVLV
ncbi:monooxygenase [Sesbania bispinosa]|nr:monooxygenase [Sesbania bispinosa]